MNRFLTPSFLSANFSPPDAGGAAAGGADDAGGGSPAPASPASPASLAAAAGIDPNASPASGPAPANNDNPSSDDASGDKAAGDAASKPAAAPDEKTSNEDAAAKLYAPDGLSEEFRGSTDKETIDKLLAARPVVPETEADYKFELTGVAAGLVENTADDAPLAIFRGLAKKHGLSNEQANGVYDGFLGQLVDQKLIPAPVDYNAELKALEPTGESDPKRASAAAVARIQAGTDLINGLKTREVLSDDDANMLFGLTNSAKGVMLLEKLAGQMKPHGVQGGGENSKPEKTQAEILYPNMNKGNG